jgi:tRNA-2-methylthio-N6-dimethylallyladenosine synthase
MRAACPNLAFSTDFIVGFPGEREEDFCETLSLVDEVGFASAFSFKYSPRPGTPAAEMADQVAEAEKTERLHRLQRRIDPHRTAFNNRCLGRTIEVLFEKIGRHAGQIVGRSPYLQPVQVMASPALIGEIQSVAIAEIAPNSLFGTVVEAVQPGRMLV